MWRDPLTTAALGVEVLGQAVLGCGRFGHACAEFGRSLLIDGVVVGARVRTVVPLGAMHGQSELLAITPGKAQGVVNRTKTHIPISTTGPSNG